MREPVLLAKQVATLDHISGGRVTLAVAAGGYRDEFESVVPDLADVSRIDLMAEGIESLRVLFERPRSTYEGKYRRFVDVESYPKPVQTPLPVFSGGNGKGALQRAGERCEGWLPAKIGPAEVAAGRAKVSSYARAAGRDPAAITIGLQSVVCIADTPREARERVELSTFDLFRKSLNTTMMKGVDLDKYMANNLAPRTRCARRSRPSRRPVSKVSSQRCSSQTPSTKCSSRCGCSHATCCLRFLTCHEPPACRRHRRRGGDGRFDGRTSMSRCRTRHVTPTLTWPRRCWTTSETRCSANTESVSMRCC